MICPACQQAFNYFKIQVKLQNSRKMFPCPKCGAGLRLEFEPVASYGKKDVISILMMVSYVALIIISNIFSNLPILLIISGPLIFFGIMFVMYRYVEKCGKVIKAEEKENGSSVSTS